jgi:hypothetical protein
MAEHHRQRRWDAGTVRVLKRDVSLLTVIGEDGGMRLPLVSEHLAAGGGGRSEAAARHWTDRMVRAGYLRRALVLRASWFTLTAAGARLAGLVDQAGVGTPRVVEAATVVDHTNTVGRLRLHFAREHPEARWIPERAFWREQQENKHRSFRRPDGALDFGDHKVGIEVELTVKQTEKYRPIIGLTHSDLTEVWWYCPPKLERRLRQSLGTAVTAYEDGGRFKVTPLVVKALPEDITP